jgi:CAAX prenyl protease-like protein
MLIGLGLVVPLPPLTNELVRLAVMMAVIFLVARPVLNFRVERWGASLLVGVLIFVLWIAPDLLFPAYRHSFLFDNAIAGRARSSLPESVRHDAPVLFLRTQRAVMVVPIVEELFWRGWLMRWVIANDFRSIPLGTYTARSFWMVALLFASEHGPYWDVALVAGIIFNWWMIRTKSLGDLILVHAVANACLSGYVIAAGKWEYWL